MVTAAVFPGREPGTPDSGRVDLAALPPAEQVWLDGFIAFVEGLPAEEQAHLDKLAAVGRYYGDDMERRIADFDAGRHPLQRPR